MFNQEATMRRELQLPWTQPCQEDRSYSGPAIIQKILSILCWLRDTAKPVERIVNQTETHPDLEFAARRSGSRLR